MTMKVGDRVRWWPRATAQFPVERCTQWIDGEVDRIDRHGRVVSLVATDAHGYRDDQWQVGLSYYVSRNLGVVAIRDCTAGGDCPVKRGTCAKCGFPVAFVHPDCIDDAFDYVNALWVGGTAMTVKPAWDLRRGVVNIVTKYEMKFHQIPNWADGLPEVWCWVQWEANRRDVERLQPPTRELTPAQIALAKQYERTWVGLDWSADLRHRVLVDALLADYRKPSVVMPDWELETANAPQASDEEIYAYNQRGGR
jgi:hypothetical protein